MGETATKGSEARVPDRRRRTGQSNQPSNPPLTLMFLNIDTLAAKEEEIREFITSSQSVNKSPSIILLAEPVIPIGDIALRSIHEDYSLTPPNVGHPDTKNAHLDTAILYQHNNANFTISPYECQEKHLGLTWIICYSGIPSQKNIAVGTYYVPGRTSAVPQSYRNTLQTAILANIDELLAKKLSIILAGDLNCPFMSPGIPIPAQFNSSNPISQLNLTLVHSSSSPLLPSHNPDTPQAARVRHPRQGVRLPGRAGADHRADPQGGDVSPCCVLCVLCAV